MIPFEHLGGLVHGRFEILLKVIGEPQIQSHSEQESSDMRQTATEKIETWFWLSLSSLGAR
jgi:hypothetical protein